MLRCSRSRMPLQSSTAARTSASAQRTSSASASSTSCSVWRSVVSRRMTASTVEPSPSSSTGRSASTRPSFPRRKRITGWMTRMARVPASVQDHPYRVDQERHVVGDDLDDGMGRLPAVLLDLRVVDPDLRRARRAPPGEVEVCRRGAVEIAHLALREVVGRDARVVPVDEGQDEIEVFAAHPRASERHDFFNQPGLLPGRRLSRHWKPPLVSSGRRRLEPSARRPDSPGLSRPDLPDPGDFDPRRPGPRAARAGRTSPGRPVRPTSVESCRSFPPGPVLQPGRLHQSIDALPFPGSPGPLPAGVPVPLRPAVTSPRPPEHEPSPGTCIRRDPGPVRRALEPATILEALVCSGDGSMPLEKAATPRVAPLRARFGLRSTDRRSGKDARRTRRSRHALRCAGDPPRFVVPPRLREWSRFPFRADVEWWRG